MAVGAGTLTFHHPTGDEVFALHTATLKVIRHAGEVELFFYVAGAGVVDGRRELTNAEVSVFLPAFDPAALVGRRFEVPWSWDAGRDDHVSCVYRYEHRDLNRNVVEVLGRDGARLAVRWTGTTDDTDAPVPEDRVVIEAAFELTDARGRAEPRAAPDAGR